MCVRNGPSDPRSGRSIEEGGAHRIEADRHLVADLGCPLAGQPHGEILTAELTAWVRVVDDDRPVDELRTVVLMDCLAPSIAAVLPSMAAVPTVELSVHLSPAVATATSPWVLLRARTDLAVGDGWCSERLDAWAHDGTHLASATQLRLVLG